MKNNFKIFAILSIILLITNIANAATKVLSFVPNTNFNVISANAGETFSVDIRVDNAATVAAASFTVTYDTNNLAINGQTPITSSFFDTFVQQGLLTNPAYVNVPGDSTDYYSPLVSNGATGIIAPVTTGIRLAAARFDNGTGNNTTIFTLNFSGGNEGTYPISIIPTVLSNTAAGYLSTGEAIPLLVGIGTGDYPTHTVATPINAYIVISGTLVGNDYDEDGISDTWETANAPAGTPVGQELSVYGASEDYDNDGYTDLQEYLNRCELDPDGNLYDPEVQNAPTGSGFRNRKSTALPGIYLLLLGP